MSIQRYTTEYASNEGEYSDVTRLDNRVFLKKVTLLNKIVHFFL